MGRSAAILLLTLALGAFAVAHADVAVAYDYNQVDPFPAGEPNEKQCGMGKPLRYSTWECPTCKRNDHCVKTKCNDYDGKADVTIDLKCLFGGKIGFVAVSYKDGKDKNGGDYYKCVNNQKGYKYEKYIVLSNLKCEDLSKSKMPKLRFIVQNKWWYNPKGQDLETSDSCYDKCTHGKPCHTCEFKDVDIPECKDYCKKPMCDPKKPECPKHIDDCLEYKRYKTYVEVKFNKDCHKTMKHVACSYKDYSKGDSSMQHWYSEKDSYVSFKAVCKSEIKFYFEDDYYRNKDAPKCPSKDDDYCYPYFKDGKVCDQCGPYKIKVPKCLEGDY